ncbi:hypothetical protein ACFSHP_20945 [Novosphingobium panipatense]
MARAVATICGKGFGCDVTAYDPLVSPAAMRAEGVEPGASPRCSPRTSYPSTCR